MKLSKKITGKLKETNGESGFIGIAVIIMVVAICLVTITSYLRIYAKYNLVNSIAHEMARYVEIKGQVGPDAYDEFERLKRAAGFDTATITFSRTGRIPLEEPFTVTVTLSERFGVGSIKVLPVNVKAVASGRSEVYWK